MDRGLTVELLWWEGCPSTDRALSELRAALAELGLPEDVQMREIRSDEEAEAEAFTGSPTILIDGVELMTVLGRGAGDEPAGSTAASTCAATAGCRPPRTHRTCATH